MNKQVDPLSTGRRPSPDNRGLEKEKPRNVEEEAAKVNRDIEELEELEEQEQAAEPKNRKKSGK